ncbi:MAG: ABC transporter permease [Betaproteobacteria bacterium]|nr:ABC transporter permease [Betaproteobacteria bacterium]
MAKATVAGATGGASRATDSQGSPDLAARIWKRHRTGITRTIAIVLFFSVWEWSVRGGGVNPLFLSSPTLVAQRLVEVFADGSIWQHMGASGEIAFWGFALSVLVGVPLGTFMGRNRLARDTLEPFIMAKYSSPTVAFLPLLIIWLGIGVASKIALVFLGAVFVIIINTEAGVSMVDRRLIETARSFTASELQILVKIIGPGALPFIIAGMRLAIGRVLIMVVVAELYAATAGLGYLIFQAGASYDTAMIFVGVGILAGTGIVLNSLMRSAERWITPWVDHSADR